MKRLVLAAAILPLCTPCRAEPAPVIHYAPGENLEHVDVALIDRAEHEIDLAAYVLILLRHKFLTARAFCDRRGAAWAS